MTKKIDRLRRQQQRLWRKAATSILSLHHNLAILVAFLIIIVLGTFWILVDKKLEDHLLMNARSYGYAIMDYASEDLKDAILSGEQIAQQDYLERLVRDPVISDAKLFDNLGTLLAAASAENNETAKAWAASENRIATQSGLTLLEDINHKGKRLGIIQLKIDRQQQEAPIQRLLNMLASITVVMMVVIIVIAWLVTARLTRSLRKLLKFPIHSPEDAIYKKLDVSSELKLMLESSSETTDSPAPLSTAESSGLHQLLAADSLAKSGSVISLKIYLPSLSDWLKLESGKPDVDLLRQLDRILLLSIHSQQGHLLSFDGINAEACFGLDGNMETAVYRAVSTCLHLKILLEELSLIPKFCLLKEEKLFIQHMKRTPVAIPVQADVFDKAELFSNNDYWLLVHNDISTDEKLLEQIQLSPVNDRWNTLHEVNHTMESMIERQLAWLQHLLSNNE